MGKCETLSCDAGMKDMRMERNAYPPLNAPTGLLTGAAAACSCSNLLEDWKLRCCSPNCGKSRDVVAGRNARARRKREAMVNGFGLAERSVYDWERFVWSKGEAVLMLMPCELGGSLRAGKHSELGIDARSQDSDR